MERAESGSEQQELKSWYKGPLESLVPDLIKAGAITGAAVEVRPVRSAPNHMLIARVCKATQNSRFIWAIVVENLVSDHIACPTASSAQDAARHFSQKRQMEANHLLRAADEAVPDEAAAAGARNSAGRVIASVEQLYGLSGHDEASQRKIAG